MRCLTSILLLLAFVGCSSSVTNNPVDSQHSILALSSQNLLTSTQTPNDPLYSQQGYLNTTNVPQAWQVTTGSVSQEIAVITMGGVNNDHEDLQSRVSIESSASDPFANNGAGNPGAGIIGASTNNGKGIAGVNWSSPIASYNIAKKTTTTVHQFSSGLQVTKSFVDLDESKVSSAINGAVNNGAKTIFLSLNWLQESYIPELVLSDLQIYPDLKIENPWQLIYTNAKNIANSIIASNKANSNYSAAINAVKNAYENGSVVVGKALEYDGYGIGFPANLASDHVVFTVGAFDPIDNEPFQYSGIPEADETSYNPKDINVIAPGVDLQTTLAGNQEYGSVSGTSASAALGAGVISLLQSADEDLTPDDIAHILEKTALPLGSPGYDNQGGYGLMDAGAVMDYVQNHDIKHRTTTDGQVQQIYSGVGIELYSSAWKEVASGAYLADIHKVTYTIPLVPSQDNDLWFNAKGTYGWSGAVPNDQNRYANVELHNDHATVTTFIYKLYNTAGGEVGWYPTSPDNLQLSYSYVGEIPSEPLSVSINGAPYANDGQSVTFSANVSDEKGAVSYQWYYRQETYSSWVSGGTGSSFTHTFHSAPGGQTANSAVKVVVNSAGETASDIHSVNVYGCQSTNINKNDVGTNIIIPC